MIDLLTLTDRLWLLRLFDAGMQFFVVFQEPFKELIVNLDHDGIDDKEERRQVVERCVLADRILDFSSHVIIVFRIFALKILTLLSCTDE